MAVQVIQQEQQAMMPKEDLARYAGQWVALRDGHVVTSDLDAVALRDDPAVSDLDTLILVPAQGSDLLIL